MKIYQITFVLLCALFVVNCESAPAPLAGGPTAVLNTFVEAAKTKDVETMKRALSKGTMGIIEQSAKKNNTTVDQLLREEEGTLVSVLPETRNEKIEGDKATLEVKNFENGQFEEIPFIKEDGAWRIALDQIVEEINEEETGEQPDSNTSDSNVSNSGGNSSPAGASSNQAANKNP